MSAAKSEPVRFEKSIHRSKGYTGLYKWRLFLGLNQKSEHEGWGGKKEQPITLEEMSDGTPKALTVWHDSLRPKKFG